MSKGKVIFIVFFGILIGGLYVSSTTFFRLRLFEYYERLQEYDKAIVVGKKAIRKESIIYILRKKVNKDRLYELLAGISDAGRKIEKKDNVLSGKQKENSVDLGISNTIEVFIPDSKFEIASKKNETKPENWTYYSGCGTKEDDPWGLSHKSYTGNYACYLEQIHGKNAWIFSGVNYYNRTPSDDYTWCPDTAYRVTAWIKADRPMSVGFRYYEYDLKGNYSKGQYSTFIVSDTYQKISLPIIFSKPGTVRYRLGFNLSNQKGRIFIDDVSLQAYLFMEKKI